MFRYERTGSPPSRRTDQKRLVGLEAVQREAVFVAVDRDGAQPELGGRPEAADGDFRRLATSSFFIEARSGLRSQSEEENLRDKFYAIRLGSRHG